MTITRLQALLLALVLVLVGVAAARAHGSVEPDHERASVESLLSVVVPEQ